MGLEEFYATVRRTVAREGLTERNLNFRLRRKCKRVPSLAPYWNEGYDTIGIAALVLFCLNALAP